MNLHDKGSHDASNGENNRPHGAMDSFLAGLADVVTLGVFGSMSKTVNDENDDYQSGQDNHKQQTKK